MQSGLWVLTGILWPFVLWADPAPPEGFSGDQYIDAQGCVFQRGEQGWTARLDGSGTPLCGFPPSLEVRRTDPETVQVLPVGQTEPPSPETVLMETLATGLRPGEFTADPAPRTLTPSAANPLPADNPLSNDLAKQAAIEVRFRAGLATASAQTSDLCLMLGYAPAADRQPLPGTDVTQGLCPGMTATPPGKTVSSIPSDAPRDEGRPKRVRGSVQAEAPVRRAAPAVRAPSAKPPAKSGHRAEMIPALARYVQIGTFQNPENIERAKTVVTRHGYSAGVGRTTSKTEERTVFAGPFEDRRSLIEALNRLRADGFPDAVAR